MKTLLKKIGLLLIQSVVFIIVALLYTSGNIIRFFARFLLVIAYMLKFEKTKSVDVFKSLLGKNG